MGGASRAHRHGRLLFVVALMSVLALVLPTASALEPTKLDASAVVSGGGTQLAVSGRLVSGDTGVDSAAVDVQLAGARMGTAPTDREGNFNLTFAVPADMQGTVQALAVAFAGDERFAASRHSIEVTLTDTSTEPPPAPEPVRSATSLSLLVTPEDPRPGELLTLTGALRIGDNGVEAGRIHFTLGGRASQDSLTYTSSSGGFTTYMEVPVGQDPGRVEVRAIFDATSTLEASSRNVAITVREELPDPTEQPADDEVAATAPTITSTPPAEPEPTLETTQETTPATDDEDAADAGTTAATPPPGNGPLTGFLVALVVVGGSALLVSIVLILRRVTRSERLAPEDDASAFLISDGDMWADPDSDDWDDIDGEPDVDPGPDADPTPEPERSIEPRPAVGETPIPAPEEQPPSRADDGFMAGIHRDEVVAEQPKPRRAWSGED